MSQPRANKLSNYAAEFIRRKAAPEHFVSATNTAVFIEAENLPADATAAVIEHGDDGSPLIVAVTDTSLYTIEVDEDWSAAPPVAVTTTMRPLDRDRCSVSVHRRTGKTQWRETYSNATWHFQVLDLTLEIETRTGDDFELDDREVFARRLAASLGWELAAPVQTEQVIELDAA